MDEKTLEKMAKEYAAALQNGASDGTLDRIVNLEEQQLDCLDDLPLRAPGRVSRTVAYLKSLTYRTLSLLSALKNETYLPSVRSRCPAQNALSRFAALQVDIFVLYDALPAAPALNELLSLENRKAALIGGLL